MRSRLVGQALILGYHRVALDSQDPFAMCVSPDNFAEHVKILSTEASPISLQELIAALRDNNLPQRAVVLTLDDGYADVLSNAKPLLERFQVPATVFIATGFIGDGFWWDELVDIILSPSPLPERLSISLDGAQLAWTSTDSYKRGKSSEESDSRYWLLMSLYKQLMHLTSEMRSEAITQLRSCTGFVSGERLNSYALTANDLIQLADGELVDIGAHTVSHPVLAELPLALQRREIEESKTHLEELLKRPVTSLSYPNGSFSDETLAIVQSAGFKCACTSYEDVVWQGSDYFQLPRFWVPDWDGRTFSRWIERWLTN
ncbi:MAG: polysaccharide deacetylase family protein [Anaerolineales bacterium]